MRHRGRVGIGVVGIMCLVAGLVALSSSGEAMTRADQGSDAAALELAQRYIARGGIENTDLLAGQVPGDLPFTLTLPPNSRVVGSVVSHVGTRVISWEVILDVPGAPPDATAFYRQNLTDSGWTTPPPFLGRAFSSGFLFRGPSSTATPAAPTRTVTPNPVNFASFCQPSGNGSVNITARPLANGMSDVHVQIETFGARCIANRPSRSALQLPALAAPSGVIVFPNGSGDSSSDATARTEMSAADLEDFYAQQLTAAGWQRISGDVHGTLAWSLWNVPTKNGDMQGYLSILEIPGQQIRDLHLQIGEASSSSSFSVAFTDPNPRPGATPAATPSP